MKLRRYGIVTAAVLAALTLGSGVTSYAANAADGSNAKTANTAKQVPATDGNNAKQASESSNGKNSEPKNVSDNKGSDVKQANNTSNAPQTASKPADKPATTPAKPEVKPGFTVVATHNGFMYSDVNLTSKDGSSYKVGDQLQVLKVYKSGNRLRYAIKSQSGVEEFVSAYFSTPVNDSHNMSVYNALRSRAEVKANFIVRATRAGAEHANGDLSGDVNGLFYKGDLLQVIGVNRVNNKFRYFVQTPRGQYYISAYSTKPVAGQANMVAYRAARKPFLGKKAAKKVAKKRVAKKHVRKVAKKRVVKKHAKKVAKKRVVKKHAKKIAKKRVVKKHVRKVAKKRVAKKHVAKRRAPKYYVGLNGRHEVVAKKALIQHATKSFKDRSGKYKKNNLKRGKRLVFNRVVRAGKTYRLHLTNGKYVTASKAFVRLVK
ncbi:DUF5776 domain-containing protein [Apilactobacillus bombintestini]|uniref:DUF5776 domain-containing protein n=1 Tax=Apilactobacillus bombintestini TaxID=2419772 RepID=A0A387ATL8_9LACO|nr:DUF5776 domain-containing protein [Apilactobacillus bombintestini]AYF92998.1 hypothetical protein D7I45_05770 [Apilactobacillus bombintestini]